MVSDFLTRLPEIDAVVKAGVPAERIYTDKKSGVTVDRAGLKGAAGLRPVR